MKGLLATALLGALVAVSLTSSARAGLGRWSVETEDDPFSGGKKVTASYSSTLRSGTFLICDTAASGFEVRVIAGWAYDPSIEDLSPTMQFAFDGANQITVEGGSTGAFGDNIAGAKVTIVGEEAQSFAKALAGAKRQVAIKDGISDKPHLLTAGGSTKAGQALVECLKKQGTGAAGSSPSANVVEPKPSTEGETPKQDLVTNRAQIIQELDAQVAQIKASVGSEPEATKRRATWIIRFENEVRAHEAGFDYDEIRSIGDEAEAKASKALGLKADSPGVGTTAAPAVATVSEGAICEPDELRKAINAAAPPTGAIGVQFENIRKQATTLTMEQKEQLIPQTKAAFEKSFADGIKASGLPPELSIFVGAYFERQVRLALDLPVNP